MLSFKKLQKYRVIKWGFIPFALIILWVYLSLNFIIKSDLSFTVLSHNEDISSKNIEGKRLTKGNKINGTLKATENYFGILSIRFDNSKLIEDEVSFRIREKGKKTWFYKNTYNAMEFVGLSLYPFGFPIIKDSKGRMYEFEIESLGGRPGEAVYIGSQNPVTVSKYKFPKETFLKSRENMRNFLSKKISYVLGKTNFVFVNFVYLLPLFSYLAWQLYFRKFVNPFLPLITNALPFMAYPLTTIIFFTILIDIFFVAVIDDSVLLVLSVLWFLTLRWCNLKKNSTLLVGLIISITVPFLIVSGMQELATKATVWIYMLLIVLAIQYMIGNKKFSKN